MNVTIFLFVVINKVIVKVSINIPEDNSDKNFRREFFRTSIDVEKIFDGIQGNFASRAFMENFYKSIDFEPKMPLEKVDSTLKNYIFKAFYF